SCSASSPAGPSAASRRRKRKKKRRSRSNPAVLWLAPRELGSQAPAGINRKISWRAVVVLEPAVAGVSGNCGMVAGHTPFVPAKDAPRNQNHLATRQGTVCPRARCLARVGRTIRRCNHETRVGGGEPGGHAEWRTGFRADGRRWPGRDGGH